MPKIETDVKLADGSPMWGLVRVWREHFIDAEELARVNAGGMPDCCTKEEWNAGRVSIWHRPCNPGMGFVNPDGELLVNKGVREVDGAVLADVYRIPSAAWEVDDRGVVYIEQESLWR